MPEIDTATLAGELARALAAELAGGGAALRLLLAPSHAVGQGHLQALLRQLPGFSFCNVRVVTLFELAMEKARLRLLRQGWEFIDDTAASFILGDLAAGGFSAALAGEKDERPTLGLSALAARAILELRMSGATGSELRPAQFETEVKGEKLIRLLAAYEAELSRRKLADRAQIYKLALAADGVLPPAEILVLPGQCWQGLEKIFYRQALAEQALELPGDPVLGLSLPGATGAMSEVAQNPFSYLGVENGPPAELPLPPLDFISAADETEELAAILRLASRRRLPLDQLEIVSACPEKHGPALLSCCLALGLSATLAEGLELGRSRAGRAALNLLDWLAQDYSVAPLRQGLLAGRLDPFPGRSGAAELARALEESGIGWGGQRYRPRLAAYLRLLRARAEENGGDPLLPELTEVIESFLQRFEQLRAAAPRIEGGALPPAALSLFLKEALAWLVPEQDGDPAEEEARGRIELLLEQLERFRPAAVPPAEAQQLLRQELARQRYGRRRPQPGAVHLCGISGGGASGRAVFFAGFSAGHYPQPAPLNPFLTDAERENISPELSTVSQTRRRREYALFRLLAAARAPLGFSYVRGAAGEEAPAAVLEAVLDLTGGEGAAGRARFVRAPFYTAAEGGLAPAAGSYLALGRQAQAERQSDRFTAYDGRLAVTAGELDPRQDPKRALTSSRLECLGRCPRAYFFQYLLGVDPRPGLAYDPALWLDPPLRGQLLHRAFFLYAKEREGESPVDQARAERALQQAVAEMRREIPPPSEWIFSQELKRLRQTMALFAKLEGHCPAPRFLEKRFGPLPLSLPGGARLYLSGIIDRLEAVPPGGWAVIDYKTGSAHPYQADQPFRRGRQLQHALYRAAAAELLAAEGEKGEIRWSGYRCPTVEGEGIEVLYSEAQCRPWGEIVSALCQILTAGTFLGTEEEKGCRYCLFAATCGTGAEESSGRKLNGPDAELLKPHRQVRAYD